MKLSYKIPLAFAVALLLMFGGALYGIHILNRSIDTFADDVQTNVGDERLVSATLVQFKLQVQEWKDTLLRGKQPAKLDQYWQAFQTREHTVDTLAAQLVHQLPPGESRSLVEQFMRAHTAMGEGYRRGFDAFKAAGFEPSAGEAAVAGVDREPAVLLERAAKSIADESAAVSAQASRDAQHATVA
ncbi:methyl-accepting chemotaxis protein, partial [Ralstonia pickettii]|nr:methyl-accepting chemotaxis protein [Ralstonia pickettii]